MGLRNLRLYGDPVLGLLTLLKRSALPLFQLLQTLASNTHG